MYSVLLILCCCIAVSALDPLVHLDYARYRGSVYSNGVTAWLGMRYAASPLGNLRFAAPKPPQWRDGVQSATEHGKNCLGPGPLNEQPDCDEDCLFLDVYAPANATTNSKLPVYFFVTGGGFSKLSPSSYNGSALVEAAGHEMVIVLPNYRVGPYGFLSGREVAHNASLNNGLKDIMMALQWTHDNVARFGGDPGHVTLGGLSAGAGALAYLMAAYGGSNTTLNSHYQAALVEAPKLAPAFTPAQFQPVYSNFTSQLNCSTPDSVACLRGKTASEIQEADFKIRLPNATGLPLNTFTPSLDGAVVKDSVYAQLARGNLNNVPAIFGDDANGGASFVKPREPSDASYDGIIEYLLHLYPTANRTALQALNDLYKADEVPVLNASKPFNNILRQVYDDVVFRCPANAFSASLAKNKISTWSEIFNLTNPEEPQDGATHGSEMAAVFGNGNVVIGSAGVSSPYPPWPDHVREQLQGFWINFIKHFDPNTCRARGQPYWAQWTRQRQQQLWFQLQSDETSTLAVEDTQRRRCAFWAEQGPSMLV